MPNESIVANSAPAPRGCYSQGVRNGKLVFLAGQLPLDASGALVGTTISEQATQTLRNVRAILEVAGGRLENLAQVTVYITDLAHWPEFNAAYEQFMKPVAVPPARAVVPVTGLNKGALVEIQAIACLD